MSKKLSKEIVGTSPNEYENLRPITAADRSFCDIWDEIGYHIFLSVQILNFTTNIWLTNVSSSRCIHFCRRSWKASLVWIRSRFGIQYFTNIAGHQTRHCGAVRPDSCQQVRRRSHSGCQKELILQVPDSLIFFLCRYLFKIPFTICTGAGNVAWLMPVPW